MREAAWVTDRKGRALRSLLLIVVFLLGFILSMAGFAQGQVFEASQFHGNSVGEKVTRAIAECGTTTATKPCWVIIGPELAAFSEGTMPAMPTFGSTLDFRGDGFIKFGNNLTMTDAGRFENTLGSDFHFTSGAGSNFRINTEGFFNASAAVKHRRNATTCATAASVGATCETVITWLNSGGTFLNTNYTVACMGEGVVSGSPILGAVTNKTTTTTQVRTVALTAAAAEFDSIQCIAFHD